MSELPSKSQTVKFDEVVDRELDEISLRRIRANVGGGTKHDSTNPRPGADTNPTAQDRAAQQQLIGLALSGGGVRSAAVCLGALQAFHRRRILPWIDYLSTVSGGGYAGGYLTSSVVDSDARSTKDGIHAASTSTYPAQHRLDESFGTGNAQPASIRRLINNGGFLLRRPLIGLNRAFIGILLIWTFVGSGLIAATALAAYLYRSLDAVPCRQFLFVLGISDQLSLDLFPPFVMFLMYLLIWAITYWRSGSLALAPTARWWLVATLIVFLVALATLMGSRDINVDSVASLIGVRQSDWIHQKLQALSHFIVPLIVTALLPFFFPSRLFQSGAESQSGIKQWIFRIASWALLAGVPFLLVAYFAGEGIGDSGKMLDDRLRLPQVTKWQGSYAKLWYSLMGECKLEEEHRQNALNAGTSVDPQRDGGLVSMWTWIDSGKLKTDAGPINAPENLFTQLQVLYGELRNNELKKDTELERLTQEDKWIWPSSHVSQLTLFYYLIEYSVAYTLRLDALDEYQFAQLLRKKKEIDNLKERIVFRMNQLLLRPDFYQHFPDSEKMMPPPGVDTKAEVWRERVRNFIREAKVMQLAINSEFPAQNSTVTSNRIFSKFLGWIHQNEAIPRKPADHELSLVNMPKNAGWNDTPWLIELRPRWALLHHNIDDEVSTDRNVLLKSRVGEEMSFYPKDEYALADLTTLEERQQTDLKQLRIDSENQLARALPQAVRNRLLATQSDSYYVVKRWSQVVHERKPADKTGQSQLEIPPDLVKFVDAKTKDTNGNGPEKYYKARAAWNVLLPDAWRELPLQSSPSATVRDLDPDLQRILTVQSYKIRYQLSVNRKLLEAYFEGMIEPRGGKALSYMVLELDQAKRWGWFTSALCVFLIVGLTLDLNSTSWHGFYSERIGSTWIRPVAAVGARIPLALLRSADSGLPYHLISGSLYRFENQRANNQSPVVNYGATELFLLSQQFAGSDSTGYCATNRLQDENYNLASAIAISGGAVNPLSAQNPIQQVLLLLANIRLGQWIQNPGYKSSRWKLLDRLGDSWVICPFRFLYYLLRPLNARKYCFVTDGGLTENLGIRQLIERRCKLILAIDAGQDGKFQFHDLTKLLRSLQSEGIQVTWQSIPQHSELAQRAKDLKLQPLDLTPVMATGIGGGEGGKGNSSGYGKSDPFGRPLNADAAQHYLLAKIEYPESSTNHHGECTKEDRTAYLVYMKSTVCSNDPVELVSYQQAHPRFPHDPTSDLDFSSDQFESYRHLGEQTVLSTLDAIGIHEPVDGGKLISAVQARFNGIPGIAIPDPPRIETPEDAASESDSNKVEAPEPLPQINPMPLSEDRLAELDREKQKALDREADVFERKGAANEFERRPDEHDQVGQLRKELIDQLVSQLDQENREDAANAHTLLLEFRNEALSTVSRRLQSLNVQTQMRRVAVIGDLLLEAVDAPVDEPIVTVLVETLESAKQSKLREKILAILERVPLENYPTQELRERVQKVVREKQQKGIT